MALSNQANKPLRYSSAAAETSSLVTGSSSLSATGARITSLLVMNVASSSNCYAQLFDGYATPAGTSVPLISLFLAASGTPGCQNSLDFRAAGIAGSGYLAVTNGLVVVLSSTPTTYTAISSGLQTFATYVI